MGKGLIPADLETWKVRRRQIVPGETGRCDDMGWGGWGGGRSLDTTLPKPHATPGPETGPGKKSGPPTHPHCHLQASIRPTSMPASPCLGAAPRRRPRSWMPPRRQVRACKAFVWVGRIVAAFYPLPLTDARLPPT